MKRNVRLRVCGNSIWTRLSSHRISLNPAEIIISRYMDLNGPWVTLATLRTPQTNTIVGGQGQRTRGLQDGRGENSTGETSRKCQGASKIKTNHTSLSLSFSFKNYSFSRHGFPSFHKNPECKNKFLKNAIDMTFSDT